jgi:hypothetical protein
MVRPPGYAEDRGVPLEPRRLLFELILFLVVLLAYESAGAQGLSRHPTHSSRQAATFLWVTVWGNAAFSS